MNHQIRVIFLPDNRVASPVKFSIPTERDAHYLPFRPECPATHSRDGGGAHPSRLCSRRTPHDRPRDAGRTARPDPSKRRPRIATTRLIRRESNRSLRCLLNYCCLLDAPQRRQASAALNPTCASSTASTGASFAESRAQEAIPKTSH